MDITKLGALAASVGGSASLVSSTSFLDSGVRIQSEKNFTSLVPPGRHFGGFDLTCVQEPFWFSIGGVFKDLDNPQRIRGVVSEEMKAPSYTLEAPQTTSGNINGCLKVIFNQIKDSGKIVGVRMEMAISRGKYGIILMNTITNVKDKGGKSSLFRALFLERNYKWEIKGGAEWTDEAFLKSANKLNLKGFPSWENKAIDWQTDHDSSTHLRTYPFSFAWKKNDSKGNNVYKQLTIKAEGSSNGQDFWGGNEEPLATSSKINQPSAVFSNGLWIKVSGTSDLAKAKDWFNLFKEEKGSWEKS